MLLEEAVLHLIERSGYRTIDARGADPTLCDVGAGLGVRGRGGEHQVDAIADFVVQQPFGNPQRLLVEAKCYGSNYRVGIEVVRNAIGVLKDASEFWVAGPGPITGRRRYNYQYAVFSASEFTSCAQRYAFAQDVHLFPLDRSRFFKPVLDAIRQIVPAGSPVKRAVIGGPRQFSEFRAFVRRSLRSQKTPDVAPTLIEPHPRDVQPFLEACHQVNYALIAVLGGRFPVLLAPGRAAREAILEEQMSVRVFWDQEGWYLRRPDSKQELFSFDLPEELLELYAKEGFVNAEGALNLKEEGESAIQAFEVREGRARIINFRLDQEWITAIRRGVI